MCNLKYTNELIFKKETDSQKQMYVYQMDRGERGWGDKSEFEINRYTLLYIK